MGFLNICAAPARIETASLAAAALAAASAPSTALTAASLAAAAFDAAARAAIAQSKVGYALSLFVPIQCLKMMLYNTLVYIQMPQRASLTLIPQFGGVDKVVSGYGACLV